MNDTGETRQEQILKKMEKDGDRRVLDKEA